MGSQEAEKPVDAVICWAPVDGAGNVEGGTGQAVRIARASGIPVFNLSAGDFEAARELLEGAAESF